MGVLGVVGNIGRYPSEKAQGTETESERLFDFARKALGKLTWLGSTRR